MIEFRAVNVFYRSLKLSSVLIEILLDRPVKEVKLMNSLGGVLVVDFCGTTMDGTTIAWIFTH